MRLAIPVLENKVAPKLVQAEGVLILEVIERRVTYREFVGCPIRDRFDLALVLQAYQVEVLICGCTTVEQEKAVQSLDIAVIHSAGCSVEDAVRTLEGDHATRIFSQAVA